MRHFPLQLLRLKLIASQVILRQREMVMRSLSLAHEGRNRGPRSIINQVWALLVQSIYGCEIPSFLYLQATADTKKSIQRMASNYCVLRIRRATKMTGSDPETPPGGDPSPTPLPTGPRKPPTPPPDEDAS